MTDEIKTVEIDASKIADMAAEKVIASIKAQKEVEDAQQERDTEIAEAAYKKAREDAKTEYDKKAAAWGGKPAAYNQLVGKNAKSEGSDEFVHWMRTGDNGANKVLKQASHDNLPEGNKALQVGSDTEGGYLAPDDFYANVVAQRDQIAWTRNVGMDIWQTSLNKLQIPTEGTKMGIFGVTAEEANYSDCDMIFGNVEVQVYKFTRVTKISEELLADEDANLMSYYTKAVARALALTESNYIAIGTGSSQPQGVTVGGTAGLTADTLALTAAEVSSLFYKLGNGYRSNSAWLMNDDTEGILRGIRDTSNWAFDPNGMNIGAVGDWKYDTFYGRRPIYTETAMATNAASAKVAVIGDFQYYTMAEHTSLEVSRNPFLYQLSGQVGFFSKARWGGAVTQAEAFQYATLGT